MIQDAAYFKWLNEQARLKYKENERKARNGDGTVTVDLFGKMNWVAM